VCARARHAAPGVVLWCGNRAGFAAAHRPSPGPVAWWLGLNSCVRGCGGLGNAELCTSVRQTRISLSLSACASHMVCVCVAWWPAYSRPWPCWCLLRAARCVCVCVCGSSCARLRHVRAVPPCTHLAPACLQQLLLVCVRPVTVSVHSGRPGQLPWLDFECVCVCVCVLFVVCRVAMRRWVRRAPSALTARASDMRMLGCAPARHLLLVHRCCYQLPCHAGRSHARAPIHTYTRFPT
jgi:hypothetical protein